MKTQRLWRGAIASTIVAGSLLVTTASPSTADPHVCGYIVTAGIEEWSEPCTSPCDREIVNIGTDPETNWTYICLQS